MGNFILNVIGAFLLTIILGGLFFERKQVRKNVEALERSPLFLRIIVALLLFLLGVLQLHLLHEVPGFLTLFHSVFFYTFTFFPHEAGHVYFWPLGEFLHVFGGTIMELLLPISLVVWSIRARLKVIRAIGVFWIGFNLRHIAEYLADARAMKLQALGESNAETHDWHLILGWFHLLEYDEAIARCLTVGSCAALVLGIVLLLLPEEKPQASL